MRSTRYLSASVLLISWTAFGQTMPSRLNSACPNLVPSMNLSAFSAVFSGELIAINKGGFQFRLESVWKGQIQPTISVMVEKDDQPRSHKIAFTVGKSYLVYATPGFGDHIYIPVCSRTRVLADAAEDLAVLGEGASADFYLTSFKSWNESQPVEILEYQRWGAAEPVRIFRVPPGQQLTISASGPVSHGAILFCELSLNAQGLTDIKRVGPRHPAVEIHLSNHQRATFIGGDAVDGPPTELQIEAIKIFANSRDPLDSESQTGILRKLLDQAGQLIGAELTDLHNGFTISFSWSPVQPVSGVGQTWEQDLRLINAELQSDPAPDPHCKRVATPARLKYSDDKLILLGPSCPDVDSWLTREEFPIGGLDPGRIRPFVYTDSWVEDVYPEREARRSGAELHCKEAGCGSYHAEPVGPGKAEDLAEGGFGVSISFKPGAAQHLTALLEHLVTDLQSPVP